MTTKPQNSQLLGILGIVVLAANVFFFLASNSYAKDHLLAADELMSTRIAFAISSITVGALAFAAVHEPKLLGHALGFLLAVASIAGSIAAQVGHLPPVLRFTLVIVGVLTGILTFHSMRGSRVAWSFLISLMAVMAVVTLFGAPKVRNLLHIGLWYAIIIPGVLAVGVVALALVRRDYRDREAVGDQIASQKSQSAVL